MRENPVITDWARVSGGSTEGTLGRLAGAAAGGAQGMLAAGARSTNSCIPCRAANLLSTRCATKPTPGTKSNHKEAQKTEVLSCAFCASLWLWNELLGRARAVSHRD